MTAESGRARTNLANQAVAGADRNEALAGGDWSDISTNKYIWINELQNELKENL